MHRVFALRVRCACNSAATRTAHASPLTSAMRRSPEPRSLFHQEACLLAMFALAHWTDSVLPFSFESGSV